MAGLFSPQQQNRVPHLRDGFIVAKVGMYALEQPALAVVVVVLPPNQERSGAPSFASFAKGGNV